MSSPAISISGLTMRYGAVTAVDDLSVQIPTGAITAVLGRNGAGKSTTLEVCAGVRTAQTGTVRVLGMDPHSDHAALSPRVGVMLQSGGVPGSARGTQFVRHLSSMYAHPLDVPALADRLGIGGLRAAYRRMSGGEQQRIRLACALVGRPELALLDEPTSGLDPLARGQVWELLGDLKAAGVTIVVSTHQFDEAERLADHVVIVSKGTVVAHGSPRELSAGDADRLTFLSGLRLPTAQLGQQLGSEAVEISPGRYVVQGRLPEDASQIVLDWAQQNNAVVRDLARGRRTLEDLFHEVGQ